jgi:peroxiredoxin
MADLLSVGAPAPAFHAAGSDGATYDSTALLERSHVALIFYPGNNTPG